MFLFSLAALSLFIFCCVSAAVCAGVLLACKCLEHMDEE